MKMKEYSKETCGEPYHPDDNPDFFLSEQTVEEVIRKLSSKCLSEKDHDTIEFIRFHERLQRERGAGKISTEEQKRLVDMEAERFKEKYGDWVHHANPLYWEFYDLICENL